MAGQAPPPDGFERQVGTLQATAINMTQMCGIGPFVTIPLMVTAMGGPQAMFGWLVGALIVLADGLIWAELGAAMPRAGGSYVYLREAFQYRTGRLMPFLFAWSAVLFIPLIMSTGVIGLVKYLAYLWPGLVSADGGEINGTGRLIGILVVVIAVVALWRRIGQIGKLTAGLFVVMLLSVIALILASLTHFHASLAFAYTPGAFSFSGGALWAGLGSGLILAVYDYLGYNTTAYLGAELKNPGRTLPRSIIYSILAMMGIYFLLQIGVLGVLPWQDISQSNFFASVVLEQTWGKIAASVVTVAIVITAFGSIFTGLLGGSRVPYEAARDKLFLPWFGKLHPRLNFPTTGVLMMGLITAIGSLFDLSEVIAMLTAVFVLIQAVAQIAALTVLRRRQPDLPRPYKQWLYPIPSVIALAGWIFIYTQTGWLDIWLSLAWLAAGTIAFTIWSSVEKVWPFGAKEIKEEFLTTP
ncbi:APC family permease [Actinocrispum wychmicini]|uniref:Amino acid transporter n=1 Tax=Actinocrispum wychmicini TaxID=1213861 RepID=A0A4R2JCT5_9PSEU|nr:APC family permease [Actinocrispum wychmicini]TCO57393.1 amino acid transporter [Actinocrispum wychmicini]